MAKNIHILFMIFCLGVFMFPKQNTLPQKEEMSCCQKEKPSKDCCSKDANQEQEHSCEGDCSQCNGCAISLVLFVPTQVALSLKKEMIFFSQKVENQYLQPNLSDSYQAIWQPPKIS